MQPKTGKPITWARPVFSPSQIAMAYKCFRQWAIRYIHGVKTPEGATRGKALGILIHDCLAHYLRGGKLVDASLDSLSENDRKGVEAHRANYAAEHGQEKADAEIQKLLLDAPQRALAGLHLIPDAAACLQRLVEIPLRLDTRTIHRFNAAIQFSDWSRLDLVVQSLDGTWFLYDHKSTAGDKDSPWTYLPTPEQLIDDVQLLLYAMCVMMAYGLPSIWCRWVYYYTGPKFPAQAKPVDVFVTFEDCVSRLQKYFDLCDKMATEIKRTLTLGVLPAFDAHPFPADVLETTRACDMYRKGCAYKGQQCNPPLIPLDRVVRNTAVKQENKTMGLDDRVQGMQANGYVPTPAAAAVTNPVPAVAAPQVAIPPGYAPQYNSQGQIIGWIPLPASAPTAVVAEPLQPVIAQPAPVANAPVLPAGDAAAGLALPGQVAAPVVAQAAPQAPASASPETAAEPAPTKAKRGSKASDKVDAAAGLDGVDAALEALRDRAAKLKAVIEVKITFDGQA